MNKVEKIKAEIDRLQSSTLDENSNFKSQYDQGIFDGLSLIDNFIDSLEEEHVSNDLEEASVNYAATGLFLPNGKEMIYFQVEKAFKAGAQWQKKQIIDKACSFLHHYQEYPNHDIATDKLVEAFKMYIEL